MLNLIILCSFITFLAAQTVCPNITRYNLIGNVKDTFQVNSSIIMLLTDQGYVYRSTDGLQTLQQLDSFTLLTFTVAQSLITGVTPRALVAGVRTADPFTLYFYGGGGRLWVTTNGGASFVLQQAGFEVLVASSNFHQTDARKMLLAGMDYCCNDGATCASTCDPLTPGVYFSLDTGAAWYFLAPLNNQQQLGEFYSTQLSCFNRPTFSSFISSSNVVLTA